MRNAIVTRSNDKKITASNDGFFGLTDHALARMDERGINANAVELVLRHGVVVRSRKARYYVMGKRDVQRLLRTFPELLGVENIQVVVANNSNSVLTVYRNENFRRIKATKRPRKSRR